MITAAWAAVHAAMLLLLLIEIVGGPFEDMEQFLVTLCVVPIVASLFMWRDPLSEWAVLLNVWVAALWFIGALIAGVLSILFFGGPDQGSGFGGSDLKFVGPWLLYLALTALVVWKNLVAMDAARK